VDTAVASVSLGRRVMVRLANCTNRFSWDCYPHCGAGRGDNGVE
jgi:hypothetical protein